MRFDSLTSLGRLSLTTLFLLSFGILVVLPVSLLSLSVSRRLVSSVSDEVFGQTEAIVFQVAELVDQELRSLSIRFSALVNNDAFRSVSSRYATADGAAETLSSARELEETLVRFFIESDVLGAIYIVPHDGRRLFSYQNTPSASIIEEIPERSYEAALRTPGVIRLAGDLTGVSDGAGDVPYGTLAVSPSRYLRMPGVRAIVVTSRLRSFGSLSRDVTSTASAGWTGIIDADNEVVFSRSLNSDVFEELVASNRVEQRRVVVEAGGTDWLVVSAPVRAGEWTLVDVSPAAAVDTAIRRELLALYLWGGAIAIAFVTFSILLFRSIVAPLHALAETMGEVETGRFDVSVPPRGAPEVAGLTLAFNKMVQRIDSLTLANKQKERDRVNAELEALQYQINPHFVSNTLNSIRLMAQASGTVSISKMTGSLMQIMTDSLRNDEREVPLSREIENLQHYAFIMKVRFGESFVFHVDVPEAHRHYPVLKMLIQPLVENAIVHGAQPSDNQCDIVLETEVCSEGFQITVRDNGVGMDPATAIVPPDDARRERSVIGLSNVHRRISLHYGDSYGLRIESEKGQGTRATILLPDWEPLGV